MTVLLLGGLVNTWFLAGNVPALVGTEYGRLLLAKIGIFIAMLIVAAVNLLRLSPRLATAADGIGNVVWRTVARLRRNALTEGALGLGVLAIVGALGTLPPGLHTEPGWPFPFRLDAAALTVGSRILLAILGVTVCICAIAGAASAAAGRYRRMAVFGAGLALYLAVGWMPLGRRSIARTRPAITPPPSPMPRPPSCAVPLIMTSIAPSAMARPGKATVRLPPVCRSDRPILPSRISSRTARETCSGGSATGWMRV